MNTANRSVVESSIPSALEPIDMKKGVTVKQKRELDDITAWLEDQEDAEMQFLTSEYAKKGHRACRMAETRNYR